MVNYYQIFQKRNFGTKPSYHKKANEVKSELFIFLGTVAYKKQGINGKK